MTRSHRVLERAFSHRGVDRGDAVSLGASGESALGMDAGVCLWALSKAAGVSFSYCSGRGEVDKAGDGCDASCTVAAGEGRANELVRDAPRVLLGDGGSPGPGGLLTLEGQE